MRRRIRYLDAVHDLMEGIERCLGCFACGQPNFEHSVLGIQAAGFRTSLDEAEDCSPKPKLPESYAQDGYREHREA